MSVVEKLVIVNRLKEHADKLMPARDWDQAFLEKVKIDLTYSSNKLEGNTISYGQTVKLLRDLVTPRNANTGEVLDLVNHQVVLNTVFRSYHSREISEDDIRGIHKELMKNIEQWSDDGLYSPGQYKTFENVTVRSSGKIHKYMDPAGVPQAMAELVRETNARSANTDPHDPDRHALAVAAFFHQKFLNEIHPFSDGNGRIGRIFVNLILIKKGYPPLFIKEVDRSEYLRRFELVEWEPDAMMDFLADRLIESLQMKIEFVEKGGAES